MFGKDKNPQFPVVGTFLAEVSKQIQGSHLNPDAVGQVINVGLESYQGNGRQELETSVDKFEGTMQQIVTQHESMLSGQGDDPAKKRRRKFGMEQMYAAVAGRMIASNPGAHMRADRAAGLAKMASVAGVRIMPTEDSVGYGAPMVKAALEAYDTVARDGLIANTIVFNLFSSRQDEFNDAFFKPITLTPDQFGLSITVPLVTIYNEIQRHLSGDVHDGFQNRKNLIKAAIDTSILQSDQTKCVPVVRPENEKKFVDPALVAPYPMLVDNITVMTAPLAVNTKCDLLAMGVTDELLKTGVLDQTDAMDGLVRVTALYLQVPSADKSKTDIIKLSGLENITSSTFTAAATGRQRRMVMNMNTTAPSINPRTKMVDGSDLTVLSVVKASEYAMRINVVAFGELDLETGSTTVQGGQLALAELKDKDGTILPLNAGYGKTLSDLIAGASIFGYDIDARRTNSNRRQRGQLLDLAQMQFVYGSKRRSPVSVPRPQAGDNLAAHADLASLIQVTNLSACAAGVKKLLETEAYLKATITHNADHYAIDNDAHGPARFMVTPFYEEHELKVDEEITTTNDKERYEAIQALILNKLRDVAFRMYRDTGYKAAADALHAGNSLPPVLIVGTDPIIGRYLLQHGDLRTLGIDFPIKVVTTIDKRMYGKMICTFAEQDEIASASSPLNFGWYIWKPEIVTELPTTRNGANSIELTVQPDFNHEVNLPVMASLRVTGIEDIAASRVPMLVDLVAPVTP